MQITASAVSLNVAEPSASAAFVRRHLDARSLRGRLLVVFVVEDIDGEHARLRDEGVEITTPIQTEPWGRAVLPDERRKRRRVSARSMDHVGEKAEG